MCTYTDIIAFIHNHAELLICVLWLLTFVFFIRKLLFHHQEFSPTVKITRTSPALFMYYVYLYVLHIRIILICMIMYTRVPITTYIISYSITRRHVIYWSEYFFVHIFLKNIFNQLFFIFFLSIKPHYCVQFILNSI